MPCVVPTFEPENKYCMNTYFTLFALIGFSLTSCALRDNSTTLGTAKINNMPSGKTDTAVFGAGCFWCTEAVFQELEGVLKVTSGYSGGHILNPTYEQVCSKTSGHVEVTRLVYDPSVISYDELLEVFWKTHDPTTVDQQGNDVGPQYRSVIFYEKEAEKATAQKYKVALDKSGAWPNPVITSIEPLTNFYPAEDYHQNYYNQNGGQMYCRYVIRPKLEKFEKVFKDKLKKNH